MIIELWQGQPIDDITTDIINFVFVPLSVGQTENLLDFSSEEFIKKTNDELKLNLSFIITIENDFATGNECQYKLSITQAEGIHKTENFSFYIGNRAGIYNETNHFFVNIRLGVSNRFSVEIEKIFSGNLQLNIDSINLFVEQGIDLFAFDTFYEFCLEALNPVIENEALNPVFKQEDSNPVFTGTVSDIFLRQESKKEIVFISEVGNNEKC